MPLSLLNPRSRALGKRVHWRGMLDAIQQQASALRNLHDDELRKASLALRYRAKSGESLDDLVVEAFALVRETARRVLKMKHYSVQLHGGLAMHFGYVAQMQTGEGKTLTATLPLYTAALLGRGAHLATANDYLAARDAAIMRPLYEALGMTVDAVQTDSSRDERREAYRCDITYGTAKEFGFDFLKDRLRKRDLEQNASSSLRRWFDSTMVSVGNASTTEVVQRGFYYGLIDEADSILIDEARTPLVVSAAPARAAEENAAMCRWASQHCLSFDADVHFEWTHQARSVSLTAAGRQRVRELPHTSEIDAASLIDLYDRMEKAILVAHRFQRDHHYVIDNGEVVIVDENTGRLAEGRKWRTGIHQAIEAKEGLELSAETGQAARLTMQALMLRYERLSGMTGTAMQSELEFEKIYELSVAEIPTHRPPQREQWTDRVFATRRAKVAAIVDEVRTLQQTGRPVLIGTRTIEHSVELSIALKQVGIAHEVLNANNLAREAEIVSAAGQRGRVTVATNMAGRGTDIQLGEGVDQIGGLHVICSELHESARIDRQLIGRCGRQGDPGSFRIYHSLDDDLLRAGFGEARHERLKRSYEAHRETSLSSDQAGGELPGRLSKLFLRAQRRVERQHFRDRRSLLHHEKDRMELHELLGEDPFLDSPV